MYKILIVEDNQGIAESVAAQAKKWNFEVECVTDFRAVLDAFVSFEPHLVLLDITLPFYNGFYWCGEIRKISKVPVIFISSASDNMNIVMAVNMGGDDFIAKPFDGDVLMAKIQALLRRTYDFTSMIPSFFKALKIFRMATGLHPVDNDSSSLVTFFSVPYSKIKIRQWTAIEHLLLICIISILHLQFYHIPFPL